MTSLLMPAGGTPAHTPAADYREVFNKMRPFAVYSTQIAFTPILYLKKEDFARFQIHFEPDKGQPGKWRLGGWFANIHAAPTPDGLMNVHIDHGNPSRHAAFYLPHGLIDWLPWATRMRWYLGKTGEATLAEMQKMTKPR